MTLAVEKAALLMTVQDLGRPGYKRFGLPGSGPMDWWAFRGANRLVGNPPSCACVEIGFSSSRFIVGHEALMAVCGSGYRLLINNRKMSLWMAFIARKGDRVDIEKCSGGSWVYLAVSGGIASPMWLGSRSSYPRAGLGRLLLDEDRLPSLENELPNRHLAGKVIPVSERPVYIQDPVIRVIPGPHGHYFYSDSLQQFWESSFSISTQSDRMGYRLSGPVVFHRDGADLVSQGMAMGEIQVPADGQPIVMMPDHPTAGGYTSIATVISADMPLIAQAQPGVSQVRFMPVGISAAQAALREITQHLDSTLQIQEDLWELL